MKKSFPLALAFLLFGCIAQRQAPLPLQTYILPNGWQLTPAGKSVQLGDLPLNMAVSPDEKLLAITNNGQSTQSVQLFDLENQTLLDTRVVDKSWYGLKFSPDGSRLYASGGNDNMILVFSTGGNKLAYIDSIVLGPKMKPLISPSGMDIDPVTNTLFVVTKENNVLYRINLSTKAIMTTTWLPGEAYAVLLSPDRQKLFISCWGCDKVMVMNPDFGNLIGEIPVGDNPNEMTITRDGRRLFVANANDNSVSVIDVGNFRVMETLNAALFPDAPSGSTTNGLALSENDEILYIANADNNCLAVFDIEKWNESQSEGFIPTGWYPTNVKVVKGNIYVTNGKGFRSYPNPNGPSPYKSGQRVLHHQGDPNKPAGVEYIGGLLWGDLSIIAEPEDKALAAYSEQVYKNTPYSKEKELLAEGEPGNPIPMKVGDPSPIKYVFYIIKENRTYDQVLSDIPGGKGDTSLLLFGEEITPNQHNLARQFVLLDNFYVDAEVSADGHNWTMGAYANDFVEKTWPTSYGGRGGGYPGEGANKLGNNRDGFLWDHAHRSGVSFRTYGEFVNNGKGTLPVLDGHVDVDFPGYDLSISDTFRFRKWQHDFDSLVAAGKLPQLSTVRFGNDHTEGLRLGRPTPNAHVADNDLAVGMFLEHLSQSPVWKESVVLIVEDDAQNGADHVDAHRSTAYLAGPYVKRNFIDHTMYTTSGFLRTIELILGMPPMTQYDAAAMPLWRSFTATPDFSTFRHVIPNVDLKEKNVALNKWQRLSEGYDFSKEDAAPDIEFAEVLWHAIKGEHVPFPGPKRAAFIKLNGRDEKEK